MPQNLSGSRNIVLFLIVSAILLIFIYLSPKSIEEDPVSIRIGVTQWPGFEYLFIAEEQEFFKQENLNIELVELSSLAEIRRAFEREKIDGMATTLVEVLEAYKYSGQIAQPVLVTDYSKGADEILAARYIKHVKDLKGKKIGIEAGSMSAFIAYCALELNGIDPSEVILVPMEQYKLSKALKTGSVDAITSYPPLSIVVKKQLDVNVIFDSSQIPQVLVDVVAINKNILTKHPKLQYSIRKVWKRTLDYVNDHPNDAYTSLVERLRISVEEFKDSMKLIQLVNSDEQSEYFMRNGIIFNNLVKTGEVVYMNSNKENVDYSKFMID